MALFSPDLISKEIYDLAPEGFIIRPLNETDYEKGFLNCLAMLTVVGDVSKSSFMERLSYLKSHNHEYFVIVIEDTKKKEIVGAGTILVERKFIHANGLVGHIEDIVTHKEYRGKNLGKIVIETLKHLGKVNGCYKIILDCSDHNVPFYEKCEFKSKGVEMAFYIDENDKAKPKL